MRKIFILIALAAISSCTYNNKDSIFEKPGISIREISTNVSYQELYTILSEYKKRCYVSAEQTIGETPIIETQLDTYNQIGFIYVYISSMGLRNNQTQYLEMRPNHAGSKVIIYDDGAFGMNPKYKYDLYKKWIAGESDACEY